MRKLNCFGLACPGPVLKCKEVIESESPELLEVLVDNAAAKENVCRFLKSRSYSVETKEEKEGFRLLAKLSDGAIPGGENEKEDLSEYTCEITPHFETQDKQLVFITSNVIGHGDDILGQKLMLNFLKTLPEMGKSLWRIILLNGGVKLATEDGEVLDALKELEKSGVSILVCGTCLDFFKLLDKKKIGETTNMLDVVTSLQMATKVIKI